MNISVVIPTINRVDLLKECLEPLVRNREVFQHILIVDNGKQDISDLPNIHTNSILLTTTSRNLGAGGSFNLGFNVMKREADWVLLLNDDIVLSDETVVALPALLEKYADKWLLVGTCSYCSFAVNVECLEHMEYDEGLYFDEAFYPAYCEDVDFEWRMKLIDKSKIVKNLKGLDPAVYRRKGSSSKRSVFKEIR